MRVLEAGVEPSTWDYLTKCPTCLATVSVDAWDITPDRGLFLVKSPLCCGNDFHLGDPLPPPIIRKFIEELKCQS